MVGICNRFNKFAWGKYLWITVWILLNINISQNVLYIIGRNTIRHWQPHNAYYAIKGIIRMRNGQYLHWNCTHYSNNFAIKVLWITNIFFWTFIWYVIIDFHCHPLRLKRRSCAWTPTLQFTPMNESILLLV